ncbi:MAG: molybdopterin-guanine dinucleotide biosynthesis protein B [ANME-2 cluster archaeon]|nr:molybdopterin-guanine dinucleotide biosynthesis protein B [ANME-2 cluster archaeon]
MSGNRPPLICIVGPSGSGKTTLIVGLVSRLSKRGYSVGTIKHHSHDDFEIDHEGKDTWQHAKAGAESVSISSPTMFALIKRVPAELTLDEISDHMKDRDVIIAEGFTRSNKPRIVMFMKESDIAHFGRGREIVATIDAQPDQEQIERIVDIVEVFIKKSGQ